MLRKICRIALVLPVLAVLMTAPAATGLAAKMSYRGNPETMVYHNSKCTLLKKCKKCKEKFATADEAKKAGYKPCKRCGG